METMIGGTVAAAPSRGGTTRTAERQAAGGAFAELLESAQQEAAPPEPDAGRSTVGAAADAGQPAGPSSPSPADEQNPDLEAAGEVEAVVEVATTGSGEPVESEPRVAVELEVAEGEEVQADSITAADQEPEKVDPQSTVAWATAPETLAAAVVAPPDPQVEVGTGIAATATLAGPTAPLSPAVEEERPTTGESDSAEEPKSTGEPDSTERSGSARDRGRSSTAVLVPAEAAPTGGADARPAEPAGATALGPTTADQVPASTAVPGSGRDVGHHVEAADRDWTPAADLAFTEVALSPETVPRGVRPLESTDVTSLLSPHEWQDPRLTAEPAPAQLLERLQQAVGQERGVAFEQLARTVLPQVTRGIATLVQDGSAEMRLQLRPPELGEIELRVRTTDSAVHGQVTVQQPAIKHLLESQLGRLREALSGQGLQLAGFDVNVNRDPRSAPDRQQMADSGAGTTRAGGSEPAPGLERAAAPMRVGGGLHAVDYTI